MSPLQSLGNETETLTQCSTIPASAVAHAAVFTVAKRSDPPDWWKQTRQEIEDLRDLEENWDSYDAHPIHTVSIILALGAMKYLAGIVGVTQPAVGATPSGQVGLSWDEGDRSLDATIREDGVIRYVYIHESDHSRDFENSTTNVDELVAFLTGW